MALTIAVFRPDLFRIVVESGDRLLAGSGAGVPSEPGGPGVRSKEGTFSAAWTRAVEDWEP